MPRAERRTGVCSMGGTSKSSCGQRASALVFLLQQWSKPLNRSPPQKRELSTSLTSYHHRPFLLSIPLEVLTRDHLRVVFGGCPIIASKACNLKALALGEGPKMVSSQNWFGDGKKRSFWLREQKSPKSLLHHPNPVLHWLQPHFGPVQAPDHFSQ